MYNGGKNGNGTYQTIINYIPPHKVYIEPFLGSGAILNFKKPVEMNYGIEINSAVIDKFDYIAGAIIICQDGISYLKNNWSSCSKDVFIYVDPPYPFSSRKSKKKIYKYEMSDKQHIELLKFLLSMEAMIMVSSYPNKMYDKLLKGWNRVEFESQTRRGKATEILYMNYSTPTELQDYSFLGENFTDRQRIKRKINRHVQTLLKLPALERNAIIKSISDIKETHPSMLQRMH